MTLTSPSSHLLLAQKTLKLYTQAIQEASKHLTPEFNRCIETLLTKTRQGAKVIWTGIGKSGKIAEKLSSTMVSTGTLSLYLHPVEAAHGDLGMIAPNDIVIVISNSGASDELLSLIPFFKSLQVTLVGILGRPDSALGRYCDFIVDAQCQEEAGHLQTAPSVSTTLALVLGDVLTLTLSQAKGFKLEDFARIHPAGALGRRLTLTVRDLMKPSSDIGWVSPLALIDEIMNTISSKNWGAIFVGSPQNFQGIITDGDLRRALKHRDRFFSLTAQDICTREPITVSSTTLAAEALTLMENRSSQISVLPVVDDSNSEKLCVGLVRLHDIAQKL